MRYFIHLGFDGSTYRGWQRQKDTPNTVQEVIEQILSRLFKKRISVYGCGRTDAGVHASQYVIQINLDEAPAFDLKFRLNKNLPDGIAVFEIFEVDEDHHCRHGAVARTYDYFIHWEKDPALIRYSSFYDDLKLDFNLMRKAANLILRTRDFKALCKQPGSYNNTLCQISKCELFVNEEQGRLRFTITGNRFLRGMVRICVFFLMKVGSGEITIKEFEEILKQKKEWKEKMPALPNGLFLSRVEYPFLELNNSHNLIRMLKVGLE
ncbi:tRNA pseudouridine(38-40) synthase TruA [Flammeovirgaceae bacterium SG7u.111]|nr:tRNA pseudouridine(38-40) synthase TruA [Flammeovirgaceae bacterium SG7u.132]WPO36100.1 tRNA pseudouridine(38-40) synthase TruA [Flammeovirgaceae bacterium SG7u.111]